MRVLIAALAGLVISSAAFAAEAEGKIQKVDGEGLTVTLDNGKSYKLPGEFDVEAISVGMDVVLAYDVVDGVNMITDMSLEQ